MPARALVKTTGCRAGLTGLWASCPGPGRIDSGAKQKGKKGRAGWLYERQRARYTRRAEGTRDTVRQRTPAKGEQGCF